MNAPTIQRRSWPTFGKTSYRRSALIAELEQDPKLQEALQASPVKKAWYNRWSSPLRRYLKEMVANPSPGAVYGFGFFFKFLWNRIFKGVETVGLDEVRRDAAGRTIVYVSAHRSHLDYCLISYILMMTQMDVPHIVAGNNLNLFGVGRLLKKGGAVFIRRVFKGKPLYAMTFLRYLFYLLDKGFPLEFFIEGGRSRTGKNMTPKTGILSMLVQYMLERPDQDLCIVPVSIVYEKLMEENAYVKELGGIPKREESLGDLLRAYKLLHVNYGKVYVSFAKSFSLRDMMQNYNIVPGVDNKSAQVQDGIYQMGMDIMDRITLYTRTSAVPLIATALLTEKRQGFRKQELLDKGHFLEKVFHVMHPRAAEVFSQTPRGLESVIDFMFQSGHVGCMEDPNGDIYFFKYQNKIRLNIYKNILIQHMVIPSLIAYQLEKQPQSIEELLKHIALFDHLFRHEFIFPRDFDFTRAISKFLEFAVGQLLFEVNEGKYRVVPTRREDIHMLSRILHPFREAFHVAIFTLVQMNIIFPIEPKALVKMMQQSFLKMLLLGQVENPEGNLNISYQNIIQYFKEEGYLETRKQNEKTVLGPGPKFESLSQVEEMARTIL